MLEIIVVVLLCKHIGAKVRDKGRSALPFQILLVVFWVSGEFLAAFGAAVVQALLHGGVKQELDLSIYLFALLGAAGGAGLAYLIVALLPSVESDAEDSFGGDLAANRNLPPPDPNNPYSSPRGRGR